MTNKMKRFVTAMLVLIVSISLFIMPAQAGDYTPEVAIPVTVKLSGTLPTPADTFRIVLTRPAGAGNPMPAGSNGDTCTLAISPKAAEGVEGASDTREFVLAFNRLGIYSYTIHQDSIGNEDCYQSEKAYNVTVYVTNTANYDGFQTNVAIYEQDGEGESLQEQGKVPVVFENRYADPAEVNLSAIKTMDNKTPKDEAFTFKLQVKDGETVQRVKNVGRSVTFAPLVFDKAGTYVYEMTEMRGLNRKITYDKSVYTATIEVTKDEDGNYQAEVSYEKNNKEYEGTPKFKNYTKTDNPTTGDMFRMGLWVSLLVLSFAGLVVLVVFWFRKRKK